MTSNTSNEASNDAKKLESTADLKLKSKKSSAPVNGGVQSSSAQAAPPPKPVIAPTNAEDHFERIEWREVEAGDEFATLANVDGEAGPPRLPSELSPPPRPASPPVVLPEPPIAVRAEQNAILEHLSKSERNEPGRRFVLGLAPEVPRRAPGSGQIIRPIAVEPPVGTLLDQLIIVNQTKKIADVTTLGMSEDSVRQIVIELVYGLEFLHRSGVIHQNIKPANVHLDKEGHVRIAGFGVARMEGFGAGLAGTLPYIAPEMLCDAQTDSKVDIWALGLVTYTLLTGHDPFPGGTSDELAAAICKHAITGDQLDWSRFAEEPHFELPGAISNDARDFIEACLTCPKNRRPSAYQLRKHLWFQQIDQRKAAAGEQEMIYKPVPALPSE